jgi:hypothetical protein
MKKKKRRRRKKLKKRKTLAVQVFLNMFLSSGRERICEF